MCPAGTGHRLSRCPGECVASSPDHSCPAGGNSTAPPDTLFPQTVRQCRRKNCGQLDLFPPRDAYHPMSEYPTYHTHGRYIPPGSTRRSPYEEVRVGPTVLGLGRGSGRMLAKPGELGRERWCRGRGTGPGEHGVRGQRRPGEGTLGIRGPPRRGSGVSS